MDVMELSLFSRCISEFYEGILPGVTGRWVDLSKKMKAGERVIVPDVRIEGVYNDFFGRYYGVHISRKLAHGRSWESYGTGVVPECYRESILQVLRAYKDKINKSKRK